MQEIIISKEDLKNAMTFCCNLTELSGHFNVSQNTIKRKMVSNNLFFSEQIVRNDYIILNSLIHSISTELKGKTSLKSTYYNLNIFKDCCPLCGFSEKRNINDDTSVCEVHHIDGNNKNNHLTNLCILCPNCHALTQNFRSLKNTNLETEKYQIYSQNEEDIIYYNLITCYFVNSYENLDIKNKMPRPEHVDFIIKNLKDIVNYIQDMLEYTKLSKDDILNEIHKKYTKYFNITHLNAINNKHYLFTNYYKGDIKNGLFRSLRTDSKVVKKRKQIPIRNCIICNKKIESNNKTYCSKECFSITNRKNILPQNQLKDMLNMFPFVTVGKYCKVSDNAIRNWCKSYNMSTSYKDYDWYKNI